MKKRVLVTGAAGIVGQYIVPALAAHYELRLLDKHLMEMAGSSELIRADVEDFESLLAACEGMDTVIHLAAEPSIHASFETLLQPNIVGTYNVFQAAAQAKCERMIYASSINAVLGYPKGISATPDMPVNPINLYGATKCFGEALARRYANHGLSALCVRIGAIRIPGESQTTDPSDAYSNAWISPRDLANLFVLCVRARNIEFAIVHGLSRHPCPRLSIAETCSLLGYEPMDGAV